MRKQIYFISESRILYFIFLIKKFIKPKYDGGVKYVTHVLASTSTVSTKVQLSWCVCAYTASVGGYFQNSKKLGFTESTVDLLCVCF